MNKQNSTSENLAWIIAGLRWLLVLSVIILYVTNRNSAPPSALLLPVLAGLLVYNILVGLLILVGLKSRGFQNLTIILDVLFVPVLYLVSDSSALITLGAALLPSVVATLRFGRGVGFWTVTLCGVLSVAAALITGASGIEIGGLLISILFLFLAWGLAGIQTANFSEKARHTGKINEEAEAERALMAHERARAIYEMARTLGATLDYNKVLDAALDIGVLGLKEMGPEVRLFSMVLLFEKDELFVVTSRRLTQRDEKARVPGRQGVIGQALLDAEPAFANSAHDDPELKYFVAFQDARSILAIPLRAGFNNYGVVVFGTTMPEAFSTEHIELLTAIGMQATVALQNAVLYQNLRDEKERIVEIEEDARKKLARDLHDGPTQSIAAIAMRVNYIRRLLEKKPEDAGDELQKVEELARNTTKEIRHMLFTLRPLVLETQGLSPALQQFALKVKETHDLDVIVQSQPGTDELLPSHAQGVLFYVVEEAVGNARKHAKAAHIYVRIYRRENYVIVEIQDDGVGFDIGTVVNENYHERGSLGMVNMRERAALVEGTLQLDSAPDKGTKIQVLVPIKDAPPLPSQSAGSITQPKRLQRSAQLTPNSVVNARSNLKIGK